jgi:hypothetical protein
VWILKATGFNRGIGIHVFSSLAELFKLLKEYADQMNQYQDTEMLRCLYSL